MWLFLTFCVGFIGFVNILHSQNYVQTKNGRLLFKSNTTHFTSFRAPQNQNSTFHYIFPTVAGTSGQVLSTDGSGQLSWASGISADAISLQSNSVATTAPTDGQALIWNGTTSKWEPSNPTNSVKKLILSEGTSLDIDLLETGGEINDMSISDHSFFRLISGSSMVDITGIGNGENGRVIYFLNTSGSNQKFLQEDPRSSVNNQLILGIGSITIGNKGTATFIYSNVVNKWVLIAKNG
ncbi:MAG: hypothetical protein ACK5GO_02235 [Ignavibacteria bacterium]|jgi:hypothetical protein